MPTLDVTGSAIPTIAEVLTKLGADPKTGLSPAALQERLNKYGPKGASGAIDYWRVACTWVKECSRLGRRFTISLK